MTTVEQTPQFTEPGTVILEAQNLKKYFPVTKGLLISKVLMAYLSSSVLVKP